ncbi:hypothetical protein J6590_092126 [Homalodisca vitripennis]|nr:hypothetical protein J6590_092126 [Homalodisca vitripennis]
MELNSTYTALPTTSALWKNRWVRLNIVVHSVVYLMRHEDTWCVMKLGCSRPTKIPFISALSSVGGKKISHGPMGVVRRLGQHGILVLGRVDGNDEGRVAVGTFVVELEDDFNIRPDASDLAFQSRSPPDKDCVDSREVFPGGTKSKWTIPQTSKKTISIILIRDLLMCTFWGSGEYCVSHWELCLLY